MIPQAELEWNRPAVQPADHRGAYAAAYRDPARGLPAAIDRAQWFGAITLARHARGRGRMWFWSS